MKYFPGPTFPPVIYSKTAGPGTGAPYLIRHNKLIVGKASTLDVLKRFMREYALMCIENYNPELYRQLRELPEPILERIMTNERLMNGICDLVFRECSTGLKIRAYLADEGSTDCQFCEWEISNTPRVDDILIRACELHWEDDK